MFPPLVTFRSPERVIKVRVLLVGGVLSSMVRLRDALQELGLDASRSVVVTLAHPQGDLPCSLCNVTQSERLISSVRRRDFDLMIGDLSFGSWKKDARTSLRKRQQRSVKEDDLVLARIIQLTQVLADRGKG